MAEEPLGDETRTPSGESDIVDEWIISLKDSLEDGPVPVSVDEMASLEVALMEQIEDLSNETIAQQLEYHSMVQAFATMAGDADLAMAAQQNVQLWEMCAARKGFTKEWEAEENVAFAAEDNFEADYAVTGTLSNLFNFSSGDTEALSGFTPEELATSSAIHGDFNQASLGYSGHQSLELRGEGITFEGETYFEAPMDVFAPGRTDVENGVGAAIRHANSKTRKNWSLYTPYKPKYYIHTSDQGQVKGQKGISNKFLVFLILKEDGVDKYRAYNAWARIGYTPGENQLHLNYEGGSLSQAENANASKINKKTRASRSKGTYVLTKYAEDDDDDDYDHDEHGEGPGCYICADAVGWEEANEASANCPHCGEGGICVICADAIKTGDPAGCDYCDDTHAAEEMELAHPYKTGFKMYLGALAGTAITVIGLSALGALLFSRNK